MYMKDHGTKASDMVLESTFMLMEQDMKDIGEGNRHSAQLVRKPIFILPFWILIK